MDVMVGDLSQRETLRSAMKGVTGVVHAACTFIDTPIDVSAMETLLEAWEEGPFVYVSSLDVYGYATAVPVAEDTALDPSFSDYAGGKIACEQMLRERATAQGRNDFSVLRAPYIFGPHERSCERLINDRLRDGKPVVLPGATPEEWGTYQDAWIDVRDLAWVAAETVLEPIGGAVNVLSGHFVWHELFENLARLLGGGSTILHKDLTTITDEELPRKRLHAQTWYFSSALLQQRLGFRPQFTLLETLEAVVATYRRVAADRPREAQPGDSASVYRQYLASSGGG
jgi:nucleoside-diphosphate-sugar epimerase